MNMFIGLKSQYFLDAGVSCNQDVANRPLMTLMTFQALAN